MKIIKKGYSCKFRQNLDRRSTSFILSKYDKKRSTSFMSKISKMPKAFCLSGSGLRPVTGFVPSAHRLSRGKQNCLSESFAFVQPTSFTPSPLCERQNANFFVIVINNEKGILINPALKEYATSMWRIKEGMIME